MFSFIADKTLQFVIVRVTALMKEDDQIRIRMLVVDPVNVVITSEGMIVRAASKARGFERYRVVREWNRKRDSLGKTRSARWSKPHSRRSPVVESLGFKPCHQREPRDPLADRWPGYPVLLLNSARLKFTDNPLWRMNPNHPRMKYQHQTVGVDCRFIGADLRVRAYPVLASIPSRGLTFTQVRLPQSMPLLVQSRSCLGGQTV